MFNLIPDSEYPKWNLTVNPGQAVLCMNLLHGRKFPGEELQEWGFDGPSIGPLLGSHHTYISTWRVYFPDQINGFDADPLRQRFLKELWLTESDSMGLEIPIHEDTWKVAGCFFGDVDFYPMTLEAVEERNRKFKTYLAEVVRPYQEARNLDFRPKDV